MHREGTRGPERAGSKKGGWDMNHSDVERDSAIHEEAYSGMSENTCLVDKVALGSSKEVVGSADTFPACQRTDKVDESTARDQKVPAGNFRTRDVAAMAAAAAAEEEQELVTQMGMIEDQSHLASCLKPQSV
mmetsp:Transcript_3514/g.6253  ORF Transcript_3514/g.6253 Transcript_3514/m.6253 type:complete len:132 (-) Transcript_3514:401-796(-)